MTSTASILRVGFGALVALLLGLGAARLAVGHYLTHDVDATITRAAGASDANAALLQVLTDAETGLRGYQLTGEPSFLQPYRLGVARYPEERDAVLEAADSDTLRTLVVAEIARADAWLAFTAPSAALPESPSDGTASAALQPAVSVQGKALFDQLRAANARVGVELTAQRADAVNRFRLISTVSDTVTASLTVLAVGVVLLLGLRTRRLLITPLENIRTTLTLLGRGDRTARGRDTGPPEVRQVVRALNELADESERLHSHEAGRARIRQQAHDLGASVRGSLDEDAILGEVTVGLGVALGVDHVYVRLADGTGPTGADRLWTRAGLAPPSADALREATAAPEWPRGCAWRNATPPPTEPPEPGAQALAARVLDTTNAQSCLLTGFSVDGELSGLLVLIQADAARAWTDDERALVEAVAADTGRGLHVAQIYAHQRELAERFQDLDRQKTDFISTVSHELRTPLTSILGYLEILLSGDQGDLSESQHRSLSIIERNAERLRELVGDLLTLSRIDANSLELAATRVEVSALIDRVQGTLGPAAAEAGLTLDCARADGFAVVGDVRQLERALLNVVGNALKFTPAGGSVRVSARAAGAERVVIEVADTGMGIPADDQDKLFQPFQRASNAVTSAIQGTGLGLAITRSIVERHGGDVALASAVDQGTTLTLSLPRAAATAPVTTDEATDPRAAAIAAAKARALARASTSTSS
ncbi:ATP-binding protein [Cryptosporangium phraense]|nr:ATP-binding protein [Cryptosporangium phraense]